MPRIEALKVSLEGIERGWRRRSREGCLPGVDDGFEVFLYEPPIGSDLLIPNGRL